MNNIYGGFYYPGTPFVFDKTYTTLFEANSNCAIDEVLIGRFVLVKYCEAILTHSVKQQIQEGIIIPTPGSAEQEYYTNYLIDKQHDYQDSDRVVCRKLYKNNQYYYEPIVQLTIDITTGEIQQAVEEIVFNPTYQETLITMASEQASNKWRVLNDGGNE